MTEVSVVICGVRLRVRSDSDDIAKLVLEICRHYSSGRAVSDSAFAVHIMTPCAWVDQPGAERLCEEFPGDPGAPCNCAEDDRGLYYRDDHVCWHMTNTHCSCILRPESWPSVLQSHNLMYYHVFRSVLREVLWRRHRFWLHAAAFAHRSLGNALVLGERNSGKSTLSLGVLLSGHKLLTDDTVVFTTLADHEWGLQTPRQELHLHPSLATTYSAFLGVTDLSSYLPGESKVAVGMARLRAESRLSTIRGGVDALLFLRSVSEAPSHLVRIGPREALWRLASHAYPGLCRCDRDGRARLLDSLASCTRRAAAFELFVGSDCRGDPAQLAALLDAHPDAKGVAERVTTAGAGSAPTRGGTYP